MPGASRTNLETFYGELDGLQASSQWAEDIMASADDKLHMSEQTAVQTVQGPIAWTKTGSMHTFASPLNITATGVNTFGGQISGTTLILSSLATFNSNVHLGGNFINVATFNSGINVLTTATFAGIINATSTGINTFAGPFDNTNTNISTFSGNIGLRSTTTFLGTLQHNIGANRAWTLPPVDSVLYGSGYKIHYYMVPMGDWEIHSGTQATLYNDGGSLTSPTYWEWGQSATNTYIRMKYSISMPPGFTKIAGRIVWNDSTTGLEVGGLQVGRSIDGSTTGLFVPGKSTDTSAANNSPEWFSETQQYRFYVQGGYNETGEWSRMYNFTMMFYVGF